MTDEAGHEHGGEIDPRKWVVNDEERTATLPLDDLRALQNAYNRELERLSKNEGQQ